MFQEDLFSYIENDLEKAMLITGRDKSPTLFSPVFSPISPHPRNIGHFSLNSMKSESTLLLSLPPYPL